MLDIAPSPTAQRYAFTAGDKVHVDGRAYQYFETRGSEHFFLPTDGNEPMAVFNNSQIARWLERRGPPMRYPEAYEHPELAGYVATAALQA